MNKKYQRYIEFIAKDIEAPYYENMSDNYGLRPDEYELVLSKVYNEPVTIKGSAGYNANGNLIYIESSDGTWEKKEYDTNDKIIYSEDSDGSWIKREYDTNGNKTYYEDSDGYWVKREYDANGNLIYSENHNGYIEDRR